MSLKRRLEKRLGDTGIRYDGRTVRVEVFINTDEDLDVIVQRIKKAAQGPKLNMAMVGAGFVDDKETVEKLWSAVAKMAEDQVKSEN